ncbi:MAG TPA: NAD-dependent epimerase/dehydratase family protein [Acidobacteriaceae bacterium]|nr:NAD-dependent epimerase/dehydratase family protein [Acidobacteriaceae bacterium]
MTPDIDSSPRATPGPVVVLGGSGFIGARLVGLLQKQEIPVRIGDLRRSETFPDLWTECDVRQLEPLQRIVHGAAAIINLAAEHRDDVRPLSRYREVNVDGAVQVCQAARLAGVEKIIFTSSVAVYGFQPRPVDESGPFDPFNAYGKTKLEAEGVYRTWAAEDPRRTLVMVRPAVVFGEGNRGNVYNLLHQIASGRFMMVGSGENVKSMAYVGNVAAFLALTLDLKPGVHIFNYVDGPDMATKDLVRHVRRCLAKPGRPLRIPRSVALLGGHLLDVAARVSGRSFPISAIRVRKFCESTQFRAERIKAAGFVSPYSLAEGLTRTIEFEFVEKPDGSGSSLAI